MDADRRADTFTVNAELTGDATLDSESGVRIFLGYELGTIRDGEYGGSSIIAAGNSLAFYVKRNGKGYATIRLDMAPIFAAAMVGADKAFDSVG